MTVTTAPLPGDYLDPSVYLRDLLFTAYAPVALDAEAALHPEGWLLTPEGIAAIQRHIADDPTARIPDFMRASLRVHAGAVDPRAEADDVKQHTA